MNAIGALPALGILFCSAGMVGAGLIKWVGAALVRSLPR